MIVNSLPMMVLRRATGMLLLLPLTLSVGVLVLILSGRDEVIMDGVEWVFGSWMGADR